MFSYKASLNLIILRKIGKSLQKIGLKTLQNRKLEKFLCFMYNIPVGIEISGFTENCNPLKF